jgi:peroxiredoxin
MTLACVGRSSALVLCVQIVVLIVGASCIRRCQADEVTPEDAAAPAQASTGAESVVETAMEENEAAASADAAEQSQEAASDESTDQSAGQAADTSVPSSVEILGEVFGSLFFGSHRAQEEEQNEFLYMLGQPAADFELESLAGDKVRLKDFQGKVVVLDFWASWCGPCMAAMPQVEKVHQAFTGQPVAVVGVNQQDDRDAAQEAITQRGATFTQVLDTDGEVGNSFGVSGIPQTVIIDPDGKIQAVHVGYSPELAATLSDSINKLLRGETLYNPEAVAAAIQRREKERAELLAKIELHDADRLQRLDDLSVDQPIALGDSYEKFTDGRWVRLPGESQPTLIVAALAGRILVVHPESSQANVIEPQLGDRFKMSDCYPTISGQRVLWTVVGAEYDEAYDVQQFTVSLCDEAGKAIWQHAYPRLDVDSYPSAALVVSDLTGDDAPEIAVLVYHDGLRRPKIGPDGAMRVLSVYDSQGDLLVRSWVPGTGGATMFALPEADGAKLLMGVDGRLARFRLSAKPATLP